MTLPYERLNAINLTRAFMRDLIDPKKTPKVPKRERDMAFRCLRHYPSESDMRNAAAANPTLWGDPFRNLK